MYDNKPTGETMSEGSDVPPMMDKPEGHGMNMQEDCVPVSALAQPGEDEQMNPPGIGDVVQYQKEGTVSRIEGDNAYVKVQAVNGKPVSAEDAKTKDTPEMNSNAEFAQLQEEAASRQT
jgi:hypothetical protein